MHNEQQTQENEKQPIKALNLNHDTNLSYEDIKKQAIANSPLVTSIPLSRFELGRSQTIKLDGKQLPINGKAYSNFLKKVLQVDPQFVKRFKKVTDEKTELTMLSTLKSGMAMKKEQMVHVLANPHSREITAFSSGRHTFRTNEALLDIFERVMNNFSKLRLRDFYMMEDGSMTISARSESTIAGNIQSEVFQGGLTFGNNYDRGSVISHNAFRMVCANGMYGFNDLPMFVGSTEVQLENFFDKLRELDNSHWMEGSFWEKMETAMNVNASMAELNYVKGVIIGNSAVNNDTLRSFLPQHGQAVGWLTKRNVNVENLTMQQEKNCPTNVNLWELINELTDFGSHDYGVQADFGRLQNAAGRLFAKQPDAKNLVILTDPNKK